MVSHNVSMHVYVCCIRVYKWFYVYMVCVWVVLHVNSCVFLAWGIPKGWNELPGHLNLWMKGPDSPATPSVALDSTKHVWGLSLGKVEVKPQKSCDPVQVFTAESSSRGHSGSIGVSVCASSVFPAPVSSLAC